MIQILFLLAYLRSVIKAVPFLIFLGLGATLYFQHKYPEQYANPQPRTLSEIEANPPQIEGPVDCAHLSQHFIDGYKKMYPDGHDICVHK